MGGFLVRIGEKVKDKVGALVGGSSSTGIGEVYITEDDEELGLKKGDILPVKLDNYEGLDVMLTDAELEKAGVDLPGSEVSSSKRAQDIKELLANKLEAPSDWKKLPNGDFVTEDGFVATPKGNLQYELKDENGNVVPGLEAAEWPDIQKHIKKAAEDEFGTGADQEADSDAPTYVKKDLKVEQLGVGDLLPQYYPIKGAEANLLKKRDENPDFELEPTDEIIGTYKSSNPAKRGLRVRDLKTGKERYFEVNKTARIYDVRQKQLTPVKPEPQKPELAEPDTNKNTVTHVATKPFWYGMDYPAGTELIEAPDLEDKNGNKEGFKWFRAIDSKGVLHGVNLNDSEYKTAGEPAPAAPEVSKPTPKAAPKNKPSKKQKEMIRSMLLERVMTAEQRQAYMDKLATVDKFDVNTLFNELKALPKAKVPLTDGTDPLNQHENPELAKIKQKLAPFDLDGSIRRYIDEKTANGGEVSAKEIRDLLKDNDEFDPTKSYVDYANEGQSLNISLGVYRTESEKKADEESSAKYKAAKEALKAKLDALKDGQAELTPLSKEEHQAALDKLVALISDENDPEYTVRGGILDGTLRSGDDIVKALRKQQVKNEYKNLVSTKFASQYGETADETKTPETWAIINAAYGLSPAPEGFEPKFVANSLRAYDNENKDLSKLIDSGASSKEIFDWLDANSPSWKSRDDEYKTSWAVDLPTQLDKARWKRFSELKSRISALGGSDSSAEEQPDIEFLSGVSEKLPEDTISSLDMKLGTAFNDGDTLSELLAKVDNEEDLQRVVDEITATRATNKDVTPELDAQLKQVQDATIQKFYEDHPDLENTMAEPANIVVPNTQPEPATEADSEASPLTVSELYSSLDDFADMEGGFPDSLYEQVDEIQEGADNIMALKEEIADLLEEGDKEAAVKKLNELADAYDYFADQVELARELGADAFSDPDFKKKDQDKVIADYKKAAAFARDLATAAKVDEPVSESETDLELEKPSKPVGKKVYTFDYGFGPNETTVDGDMLYGAVRLVRDAYVSPEAKGIKKSEVEFAKGQVGLAMGQIEQDGDFKDAAGRFKTAESVIRTNAEKLKDKDAKAKVLEMLDKAKAVFDKAVTKKKLSNVPTPFNEKSPDGEVLAKPVVSIPALAETDVNVDVDVELEKPSKPLGTKVYTFDYGFGPNEITVDGDTMYGAAQLVKAAYDLPEAKGLKKSDVEFTRGQIGYALRALDGEGTSYPDAGNFKEAASRISGSIKNVRLYASKLKDEDAKAKINEALDKAEAVYNKAYTEVKLSEEPTPYNEKSPDGEVLAKPVKFIPPAADAENEAEPAVVEPQNTAAKEIDFGTTQTYKIGDTVYADYDPKDTGIGFIRTGKVIDRNLTTGDYLVEIDDTTANGNSAGKKLAFNKKDMAPLAATPEAAPVEQAPETVENPYSTDNSDKLLVEAKTNRQEIDDVDSAIAVAIENAGVNYTPMLFGVTGNEHIVKNILDDLDASDGANSIALSSSLYELQQALVDAGIAPLITEHIKDIADAMDAFTPAEGGEKSNLVTVDTIKQEQDGILDLSNWKKVGGQKGSNPGGTYENPETGEQVYVKTPKSQLHGENERLASALYDAAGISSAKVLKGKLADGTEVTYSPMIEGSSPDLKKKLKDKAYMARLQQGFAIDALLANWDVIGLDYDNVVTDKNGEPVRVDPGGALLFRAQGSPKGGAFGEDVPELDAFTDKTSSRPSAKVFSQMTDEQKLESAKVLQNLSPSQIEELVNSIVTDPEKREELKTKLKARREAILNKFELSTKPAKKKNPEGGSSGKTVTLDVNGDNDSLKAQLEEAAKNGDLVSFKYNDKERIVAPTYVWTNPKNGNINMTGDEDGVSKNYTLQNFKQSSVTTNEEAAPAEAAPAETTALNLGDENIRTEAAKSVQSQLPDGYTATPEKGVGNTGFVMVKNAQGETVAMMTNDPDDPNKIAVQNFKAGWKIETVSSVSEGMSKLVDAVKVVEEPGQVVQLSDGSTGKMGGKVVHSKNGITGTIVGFQKDPNYVKVKPDNGDPIKIMSINQIKSNGSGGGGSTTPSAPNAPEAPSAPEAPTTFVPNVSESLTMFTDNNGTMSKVAVIKTSEGKWDVVYDFNGPDFKPLHVDLASREEAEAKALTALGTNNFESDVPDADTEPAEPKGPKKFTFDFMGLKDVEDAPEVKDSGDPLDGENEKIKADSAGTLIKPGAIVKDANGRVGVYRTPGYGDPNKIRMIWEDGTQDSVMPDTVTATGKYLSPGIAGVYAGLADLDFDKNAVPMPDNYTGGLKDKNGKDIGFKQLVIDKSGDMGVVVDQYGTDGYIKVAYPDGTKNRKADTVTALDLQYKKNDYNIKIAQKHYKSLAANDAARYNLPSFGVTIKKSNVEVGKIPVSKNAFGAKAKEVKNLGWNESDFKDAPSLESLLAMVSDTNKPGSGIRGGSIALDSDSVEDLDLRVMAAIGTDGNDAYLLKYKLTNWAGDALANQLVEMVKSGDPRITVSTGLSVPENSMQGDKVSFNPSLGTPSEKVAYKNGYGQTFIITLDDGTKVHFLRADVPTNHKTGAVKISEYAPKAFHNKVMIIAPKDKSTPESLALALQTAGVQDVRPSTKADAAILIENRLMSIFDEKVDPRTNPSGIERAASLQRIKDKWGIGPENITIKTGAGGRIEMRLDEESAKRLVQKSGVKVLRHNLTGNSVNKNVPPNETPEQRRERIADYFISRVATPQGGLLATTTRWTEGVGGGGMSSSTDVNTGGADYVFTTPLSQPNSSNSYDLPLIYFSGERVFQRLDFWANQNDKFGKRIGKNPAEQAVPGGYEVMLKGRLSFDDAEVLMVNDQTMRTLIITKLRQKGITEIGGRPLEAVIMTGEDYKLAKLAQSTNITT
jgi:inorganic pyrophosphatase